MIFSEEIRYVKIKQQNLAYKVAAQKVLSLQINTMLLPDINITIEIANKNGVIKQRNEGWGDFFLGLIKNLIYTTLLLNSILNYLLTVSSYSILYSTTQHT